jgi:hypothetical protein
VREKKEGATVGIYFGHFASLPSSNTVRAVECRQDGQRSTETSPNHQERLIKYQKCPTTVSTATTIFSQSNEVDKNVLSYEQNFIKTDDLTKQMKPRFR